MGSQANPPDLTQINDTLQRLFATISGGSKDSANALTAIAGALDGLARVATQATTSIGILTAPLRVLGETLSIAGKALSGGPAKAASAPSGTSGGVSGPTHVEIDHPLPLPVEVVNFPSVGEGGTPTASSVSGIPLEEVGGEEGGAAAGEAAMGLGEALSGVGAIAIAAAGAFEQLVGVAQKLVAVASPQVAFQFNRALLDLQATVGTAFIPFISALTDITRQIAGELYPVMKQIAPFFGLLASVVGNLLLPVFQRFGIIMEALQPVLDFLLEYWTDLNAVLQAVNAIWTAMIKTVVQLVQSLFAGISLKTVFEAMRTATIQVITALLQFAIRLASLFGVGEQFKQNLLDALQPNKDYAHAPSQATQGDLLGIIKSLNEASAVAVGAGSQEHKFDFKDIFDAVKNTDTNSINLIIAIHAGIDAIIAAIPHLPDVPAFVPGATVANNPVVRGGVAGFIFGGH